ncbi:MAG: hypothetical protein GX496_12245, partial [Firmicutes bacterium]|nr:hypothetical protein [Bacillota bacterium]
PMMHARPRSAPHRGSRAWTSLASWRRVLSMRLGAPLEPEVERRGRELAARAFAAIGCEGMARVDFFVRSGGEVLVNEINTIPGFTAVSMYPRLWEASGLPYPQLLDRLVEIALAVHEVRLAIRAANAEYRLAAQGGGVRGPKSSG